MREFFVLWILIPIAHVHALDHGTNTNELFRTDPIIKIHDFLTRKEQRNGRLINRHFNQYHNKANPDIIDIIHRLSVIATEIIRNGTIKNETITELKAIHQKIKFKELFLKKWPAIVAKSFPNKAKSIISRFEFFYSLFD